MSRLFASLLSGSLLLLPLSFSAAAQTAGSTPDVLGWKLTGGATLERFLGALRQDFRQLDADGDGAITAADLAFHDAAAAAVLRNMAALQIMNADLDDDGVVTAEELRRRLHYDRRMHVAPPSGIAPSVEAQIEQQVEKAMAADVDKDGRITWQEAAAAAKAQPNYARAVASGIGPQLRGYLTLVPDGKPVRWEDVEKAAGTVFRLVDSDGNGTVSQDELEAYRRVQQETARKRDDEQRRRAQDDAAARRPNCVMPKASDAAKVVLMSAYRSESISTVALGSQDVATEAGQIIVEPGSEPLYLVISTFRPTIWRVSGAVERIERLVMAAHNTGPNRGGKGVPLAGATGVAAERVTFLADGGCLPYVTETPSSAAAKTAAVLRREAGKDPAIISAKYGVGAFVIPSGEIRTLEHRRDQPTIIIRKTEGTLVIQGGGNITVETGQPALLSELYRFHPGGIVDIDPVSVVASVPVMRYEVMPQESGLLQLMQSGALGRNRSGEFLIKQKIRFPAELYGAHSVKFLLLRGVPKPDGDPGHSEVVSEETGEKLDFPRQ